MSRLRKIKYAILNHSIMDLKNYFKVNKKLKNRVTARKLIIDNYLKNNNVLKLHLGCASTILEGWLNTDICYSDKIAYLNAADIYPLDNDSFDYIFSEHMFEHLTLDQQIVMLKECYRVLKKGGIFRLAMPSLDFLFDLYVNHNERKFKQYAKWAVNEMTSLKLVKQNISNDDQYYTYVINNFFKDFGHQTIHNLDSFKYIALKVGFSEVTSCSIGVSSIPLLNNIEKHGTSIPSEFNELETMVVEIKK